MAKGDSNLFVIAIVACVAIVSLFLMVQNSQQVSTFGEDAIRILEKSGFDVINNPYGRKIICHGCDEDYDTFQKGIT